MSLCLRTICLIVAVGSAGAAVAKDAYYDLPLRELKLVEGSLPVGTKTLELAADMNLSGRCGRMRRSTAKAKPT